MKKVLMIASTGGHLEEVMALQALKEKYHTVLVTEQTVYDIHPWQEKTYILHQVNRKRLLDILRYPGIMLKELNILNHEKPDAVLSTGAMIAFPMLLFAKLKGIKTIFVECMFNTDHSTLTGKLAYKFVDLFIVQWESMLKVYPNAVFGGRVF